MIRNALAAVCLVLIGILNIVVFEVFWHCHRA